MGRSLSEQRARIDAIPWYHEFDFGSGLRARSRTPDVEGHRVIWQFIEEQLAKVDFRDKSVLDIGCWDGYWSFYAERRGARGVLATDDLSQNWSDGAGVRLARELYGSAVEINQDVSIYRLAELKRRFDVILCLGVYYHLLDPFYALSQVRHCCHPGTVVVIEGNAVLGRMPPSVLLDFENHNSEILPTLGAMRQLLQATYFSVGSQVSLGHPERLLPDQGEPPVRLGWRWRLKMCAETLRGSRSGVRALVRQIAAVPEGDLTRVVLVCQPFTGRNAIHPYVPPFGLHVYDERFQGKAAA